MKLGLTFSHRHARHLGLDPIEALSTLINLNLDYIRLCLYWDETNTSPKRHTFEAITPFLELCSKANQSVVLALGAKAPRWPEFYIPSFVPQDITNPKTQHALVTSLETIIKALQSYSIITHWQLENEPLDPSGPSNTTIPLWFLTQEIALLKSLDNRPVILTAWGNTLTHRNAFKNLTPHADILGIDLYYKQHLKTVLGKSFYTSPMDSTNTLNQVFKRANKPIWITELQAEPWEKDEDAYKSSHPQSLSPAKLTDNFSKAQKLNVDTILFWGSEYWLWQAAQGNHTYLDTIKHLTNKHA